MNQKKSRKTEKFDKLISENRAGSRLIIVPGFGAKKQAFRAKQIVPKTGVKFGHNHVKSVIKGTSEGFMVPNLKPLNSRVIASNTAEFERACFVQDSLIIQERSICSGLSRLYE